MPARRSTARQARHARPELRQSPRKACERRAIHPMPGLRRVARGKDPALRPDGAMAPQYRSIEEYCAPFPAPSHQRPCCRGARRAGSKAGQNAGLSGDTQSTSRLGNPSPAVSLASGSFWVTSHISKPYVSAEPDGFGSRKGKNVDLEQLPGVYRAANLYRTIAVPQRHGSGSADSDRRAPGW